MHKSSMVTPTLSRRRFISGTAAIILTSTTASAADIRWRLGSSQPLDSPNVIRLKEMAERIRAETNGGLNIEVFGAGVLGSDNAMLSMLQKNELEMYMAGNVLGPLVPVTEMPGLPFTFKNADDVFAALDAELGDYIRAELLAKGIYQFRYGWDNGFHHLTTSTKPVRTVEDLAGMTIRTPVQKMTVDFFETLGAKPKTFTLNRLYEVLKDKTCDGQTDPLGLIILMKLYEVQTYLSLTNHWWSGFTLTASAESWKMLSSGLQQVVEKHAKTAALAQRQDIATMNAGAVEVLSNKGMLVNECDTSGFKKPLASFYTRWKDIYGSKAWSLLEARVGKLV
jgi:tripartite ATP-independent transporter DctP family solute receptor